MQKPHHPQADKIAQQLRGIDYAALPISDYSRSYIVRMMPHLDYYLDIYQRCLCQMLEALGREPSQVVMVDYGGGHGFLSLLAKALGVGRVIYIDYNPQAVETVTAIGRQMNLMPDDILQSSSSELRQWCHENSVVPDALLGMDVIEHIYRLDTFFADLQAINPRLYQLYTTGSTPYNRRVAARLRAVMQADEIGHNGQIGFFQQRRDFIAQHFPTLSAIQLDAWAQATRGLVFDDILQAVETGTPADLSDSYNTCDPATGSWTERILTLEQYQQLAAPNGFALQLRNGFYNPYRSGIKGLASQLLNIFIRNGRHHSLAPFIILHTPQS